MRRITCRIHQAGKKGDAVEVVGVKVQFDGLETIFAREVTRNGATFVFRDKDGFPAW